MKKRLAELGYRFSGDQLDEVDATAFTIISTEISKIEHEQSKRRQARTRAK